MDSDSDYTEPRSMYDHCDDCNRFGLLKTEPACAPSLFEEYECCYKRVCLKGCVWICYFCGNHIKDPQDGDYIVFSNKSEIETDETNNRHTSIRDGDKNSIEVISCNSCKTNYSDKKMIPLCSWWGSSITKWLEDH